METNPQFKKYVRNAPETAVDVIMYYAHDPKRMKREYPNLAKMVKAFFSQSSKVQFFSHPLAMALAVVLAMLLKQEQAEEEEKQETQKSGEITISSGRINIGTASGQVLRSKYQTDKYSDRQGELNDFRTRLNDWEGKKDPDELKKIADSVGSLFQDMKRTSTRSTKPGMR